MEDILQLEPESLKPLDSWEPNSQQKIKPIGDMQDALGQSECDVYDILFRASNRETRLTQMGVDEILTKLEKKYEKGKSYSTVRRAIYRLLAKGVIEQIAKADPKTHTPRIFRIKMFMEAKRFWRSEGWTHFTHIGRSVRIVTATGELVEMKRPPQPEAIAKSIRVMVGKVRKVVHQVITKAFPSQAPPQPTEEERRALQIEIQKAEQRDRQERETALMAKQAKSARRADIQKRLNELWVQLQKTSRGSPEWHVLNDEAVALSKEFKS